MSAKTGIEWTDHTFNIAWGCFKVSPGCANCYAETLSAFRYPETKIWGPPATTARRTFGPKHWAEPYLWNSAAARAGVRKRVFCSSMCDVFEAHPVIDAERVKLWPLIRSTPWLDWQLLTKRPERLLATLPADWGEGYSNVWLGTSVEDQERADERIPYLLDVPAAVRFLSVEPLLGPVDLKPRPNATDCIVCGEGPHAPHDHAHGYRIRGLDWVIVGGESGAGARPMDLAWVRTLRDQCALACVAFFVKQLGAVPMMAEEAWRVLSLTPLLNARNDRSVPDGFVPLYLTDRKGGDWDQWPIDLRVREFPRARTLAGITEGIV